MSIPAGLSTCIPQPFEAFGVRLVRGKPPLWTTVYGPITFPSGQYELTAHRIFYDPAQRITHVLRILALPRNILETFTQQGLLSKQAQNLLRVTRMVWGIAQPPPTVHTKRKQLSGTVTVCRIAPATTSRPLGRIECTLEVDACELVFESEPVVVQDGEGKHWTAKPIRDLAWFDDQSPHAAQFWAITAGLMKNESWMLLRADEPLEAATQRSAKRP